MVTLGLGQLTAIDVDPVEYIAIAAATGCQTVSLFVTQAGAQSRFPLVTGENCDAVKEQLLATGIQVANVECFMLTPKVNVEDFRAALELGAELGARGATALLYDNDEARVAANLTRLCQMAAEVGLRINIEFMPLAPNWKTLQHTTELIRQLNQPNLGLCIDLLHLIRSGGTPADVAAADAKLIYSVQLCDSLDLSATADYAMEAGVKRLAPGEGKFPTVEFLKALPAGMPLELEVPQLPERPALERVTAIVEAARRQIALAGM